MSSAATSSSASSPRGSTRTHGADTASGSAATAAATSAAASTSPTAVAAGARSPPHTAAAFVPFLRCSVVAYRSRVRNNKTFTEFQLVVTSPALHWDAHKRYSEFATLHSEVVALIGADKTLKARLKAGKLTLPKLPPSKLVGNLKDDFLQERMTALDTYISALLAIEHIDTCRPVLEFLGALESSHGALAVRSPGSASAGSAGTGGADGKTQRRPLPRLHLDAVLPLLDAGDVVLFRTTGTLQSLQRTFTSSRYDHIGVVIRIPWGSKKSSALHLLESTSDGVRTYQLSRRMRAWHLSNAVVVVRQLKHVRRTDSFLATLDSFVSDVDGLPYGLTLGKLLKREPGASKDTFFCSELVATAYMRVGLIDSDRHSATAFFPSDFNQDNSARLLQLKDGAELGPELQVDFVQPAVLEAKNNLSDDDEDEAESALVTRVMAADAKQRRSTEAVRKLRSGSRYDRHFSYVSVGPAASGGADGTAPRSRLQHSHHRPPSLSTPPLPLAPQLNGAPPNSSRSTSTAAANGSNGVGNGNSPSIGGSSSSGAAGANGLTLPLSVMQTSSPAYTSMAGCLRSDSPFSPVGRDLCVEKDEEAEFSSDSATEGALSPASSDGATPMAVAAHAAAAAAAAAAYAAAAASSSSSDASPTVRSDSPVTPSSSPPMTRTRSVAHSGNVFDAVHTHFQARSSVIVEEAQADPHGN